MASEVERLTEVLRQHLPSDRYDDDGHNVGTFCSCGGWDGDYFADGEAGPFDDHLAAAILASPWLAAHDAEVAARALRGAEQRIRQTAPLHMYGDPTQPISKAGAQVIAALRGADALIASQDTAGEGGGEGVKGRETREVGAGGDLGPDVGTNATDVIPGRQIGDSV